MGCSPRRPESRDAARRSAYATIYCKFAVTAVEFPWEFVNVTVTDVIPCRLPVTVNGCAKENWLPNGADAELAYHAENRLVTGTTRELVCRLDPEAAVNVKVACVTLRGVANPITVTVKPSAVRMAVTLVMLGTAAGIRMVTVGAGVGVMS